MKTYEFTLIIPDIDEQTADSIYEACNDSSTGKSNGITYVSFDRESESLESALESAIANLKSLGINPLKIEMEVPAVV